MVFSQEFLEKLEIMAFDKQKQRIVFISSFIDESKGWFKQVWKEEFCREVAALFHSNSEITTEDLENCAERLSRGERSAKNTWKDFVEFYNNYKSKFERFLINPEIGTELQHYPLIERIGKGNEPLRYRLVGDNDKETISGEPFSADLVPDSIASNTVSAQATDNTDVIYQVSELESPPYWYFWIKPFFNSRYRRLALLFFCIIFIGVVPIVVGLAISSLFQPIGYTLAASLVAGALMSFIVFPLKKTYDVIDKKLCLLDSIKSKVLVSQPTPNQDAYTATRDVLAFHIEANCPVCISKYGLKNSITLEKKRVQGRKRVIGICNNNPVEHRFTFDKDNLTGVRLS
ncbi:hypothetical protein [Alkalimarinus sediminis]|uniref:Uncharacterized protein n=1 Tax=Alkalimarinus sediminis TaxID=1632866 RepID=A0A9E8HH94_9ALTE|nr:hypothetical protein [Alkalimarinus sediminis]UZW74245.1 hypothetical protein NNL22_14630 [Alkalimarinus sediminis]